MISPVTYCNTHLLVAQAREQVGRAPHPTPRACLDAIEALGIAACRNDGRTADSALLRAEKTIEKGDPSACVDHAGGGQPGSIQG